jgi:ferredoxin
MKIESLKLVYFSPTGTTKKIVQGIAKGMKHNDVEQIDITSPGGRIESLHLSENDLIIIGVPVYMGRVPALLSDWLHSIKAQNTPTVCVVVYGNRDYENALLELKDVMAKQGCVPIAGAAFIGEHSFSSNELPTAANRPDRFDLKHASEFGQRVHDKLRSVRANETLPDLKIPGNYPYGGVTELWDVDFISVSEACTNCETCTDVCPVGAIDADDSHLIDIKKCITCCACIKNCPENARSIKPGLVLEAAKRLSALYSDRKEPVYFY